MLMFWLLFGAPFVISILAVLVHVHAKLELRAIVIDRNPSEDFSSGSLFRVIGLAREMRDRGDPDVRRLMARSRKAVIVIAAVMAFMVVEFCAACFFGLAQ